MEKIPQVSTSELNVEGDVLRDSFRIFTRTFGQLNEGSSPEDTELHKQLGAEFVSQASNWALDRGYEADDTFYEQLPAFSETVASYFESNTELMKTNDVEFLDGLYKIAEEYFPQK